MAAAGAAPGPVTVLPCPTDGGASRLTAVMHNDHGDPESLHIYECSTCNLLYVGTLVTEEQLKRVYETHETGSYYLDIDETSAAKAERAANDLRSQLCRSDAAVLDVGCGFGHFLRAARRVAPGATIVGTEFDEATAAACEAEGFQVITGPIDGVKGRFSVVTMLDVAEHVQNPAELFRSARRLLAPGGVLYLHTPRRCVWDTMFIRLSRRSIPRGAALAWIRTRVSIFHLRLWSDDSLMKSLRDAGFEIVEYRQEMELSWPLERYTRVYLGEKLNVPQPIVRLATSLANLIFVRFGTLRNKAIVLARATSAA